MNLLEDILQSFICDGNLDVLVLDVTFKDRQLNVDDFAELVLRQRFEDDHIVQSYKLEDGETKELTC